MRRRWLAWSAVVLAIVVGGCAREEESGPGATEEEREIGAVAMHEHHALPGGLPVDEPLDGMSVYQLGSTWTDQHGTALELGQLRGRPRLIAMVYTHCGSACPRIVADMKRIEAEHPGVGLVLVSIDPERDTPGRLLEFAQGSRLGENWTLLRGSDDDLLELAAVLGVRYRRISPEEFMHSNLITLLDADGAVVHRQEGLGEVEGTLAALHALGGTH